MQNILYKTIFTINYVGNTRKFYNFVRNNYPQRNYLPIKILRKNGKKKSFLANLRKIPYNMRISSSVQHIIITQATLVLNLVPGKKKKTFTL